MTLAERRQRTAEADAFCAAALDKALDGAEPTGVALVAVGGYGRAELAPRQGASEEKVLRELVEAGLGIRSFTPARISLDEIFIKVYGEQHELGEG